MSGFVSSWGFVGVVALCFLAVLTLIWYIQTALTYKILAEERAAQIAEALTESYDDEEREELLDMFETAVEDRRTAWLWGWDELVTYRYTRHFEKLAAQAERNSRKRDVANAEAMLKERRRKS